MTAQEIVTLSMQAHAKLSSILQSHITDGKILTESIHRSHYIEYWFNDGTMVEMAVVRDFNDNMNPTHVVLNEYVKVRGHHGFTTHYNRLYTEQFEVSQKKVKVF